MNDSALTRFFGVVTRPRTWLGIVFHLLAFPLGLFYFVFLVTGISVGVGLVVIWIGIPILLVVAGAWWLFAAFERVQAQHLLGARLPAAPRPWERADGVWGKLKAHFGAGSTWLDLAYLIVKLPFGIASFSLVVSLAGVVGWLFAMPFMAAFDVPVVNGTWVPPLWFGILCVPLGALAFVVSLHVLNAWGWVCARWAELMFGGSAQAALVTTPPPGPLAPPAPLAPQTAAPHVGAPSAPRPASPAPAVPVPAPPAAAAPVTAPRPAVASPPELQTAAPDLPEPPAGAPDGEAPEAEVQDMPAPAPAPVAAADRPAPTPGPAATEVPAPPAGPAGGSPATTSDDETAG